MRRLAFVCAIAAGCNGGISEEVCRKQAGELSALFAASNLEPSFVPLGMTTHPVMRTDLPAWSFNQAPIVYVAPGRIAFPSDDHPVRDRDELRVQLVAAQARVVSAIDRGMVSKRHPPNPRNVFLVIDGATPWREVVDVVSVAEAAGQTSPVFVFELPTKAPSLARLPIDDQIDKALANEDGEGAMEISKLAERQIEHCPAAKRMFGNVASVESEDRASIFVTGLSEALVECGCKVDMPNLRAVMMRVMVNPHPVRGIAVDISAATDTIALPAATPWSEASKRFTPSTKTSRLVVAE